MSDQENQPTYNDNVVPPFNIELETTIYTEILSHFREILNKYGDPKKYRWRGLGAVACMTQFIQTSMQSQYTDPHRTMEALDHMFIQMIDIYTASNQLDEMDISELPDPANLREMEDSGKDKNITSEMDGRDEISGTNGMNEVD